MQQAVSISFGLKVIGQAKVGYFGIDYLLFSKYILPLFFK